MKNIIGVFILFLISSCNKKEEIPLEFKHIEGEWVGIDSLILYTIHFNNKRVEIGNKDKVYDYPIISINYNESSNVYNFYCKSSRFYKKFKKANNWNLSVNMNSTFDTITYKSLKYVRL